MVRWIVGSILHGVNPLSYFSFQSVLHASCNKDRGMFYPVCVMVHIKEPLLLMGNSSPCPIFINEVVRNGSFHLNHTACINSYDRNSVQKCIQIFNQDTNH